MYIIVKGSPVGGFQYFGPFPTRGDASAAGHRMFDGDCWVSPLVAVTDDPYGHTFGASDHCSVCYCEIYEGDYYDGCSSGGDEVNNTDPVVIGRLNLALAAGVPSPNRAARRSMVRRRKGGAS